VEISLSFTYNSLFPLTFFSNNCKTLLLILFFFVFHMNTSTWLWSIARGINGEEVQGRLLPKSHGAGKSFPGPRALKTIASV
jgi:hypothetical protein